MMSVQNPYNLVNRTYEIGLQKYLLERNVDCLLTHPLSRWYLSGKYRNKQMPKNSRMERDGILV